MLLLGSEPSEHASKGRGTAVVSEGGPGVFQRRKAEREAAVLFGKIMLEGKHAQHRGSAVV